MKHRCKETPDRVEVPLEGSQNLKEDCVLRKKERITRNNLVLKATPQMQLQERRKDFHFGKVA